MQTRQVSTALKHREEVFHILALAEATGLPILLEGPPGVGKTEALLDWAKAKYGGDRDKAEENSFIIELDESTKPSEIKGKVDIEKLTTEKKWQVNSPVAHAGLILINEVDKGGSGVRNSMLAIMNEKKLYNGHETVDCDWSVFCGACNEIPKEEKGNPFWDRFVIKLHLERLDKDSLVNAISQGMDQPDTLEVTIPDQEDIDNEQISLDKMKKFVSVCHSELTDRTLGRVPKLAKAAKHVYGVGETNALIRIANLLASKQTAQQLAKEIEPKEIQDIRSDIKGLEKISESDHLKQEAENIKNSIERIKDKGYEEHLIKELADEAERAYTQNPIYQDLESRGGFEEKAQEAEDLSQDQGSG